jgi:phosphate transport system permease protein
MAAVDTPPHAESARGDITAHPPSLAARRLQSRSFVIWGIMATAIGLGTLLVLVWQLWSDGGSRLTWSFFTSFPSADPERAGILSSWVGSILVILTTAFFAIPIGILSGVYLEEYAPKNWITGAIEIAVNNLAGVPSIIFGLLALGLFVQTLGLGQSILVAGLTLALLILPVVIVATREAVRAVPQDIRQAALSVGATKWQATQHHVLPYALPGVVTGIIIGISRAIGETAPLILIGGLTFVAFLPITEPNQPLSYTIGAVDQLGNPVDPNAMETVRFGKPAKLTLPNGDVVELEPGQAREVPSGTYVDTTASWGDAVNSWMPWNWAGQSFTVMPIQMFNWTSRPEEAFRQAAAAAGLVLLAITLLLNGFAIWLRYHLRRQIRW